MQVVCLQSLDLGKHCRIPALDRRRALRRRFSDNAFILEEPKLKFYLAAPLVTTNGHRLGTLCVVGQKARRFTAEQANMLAGMAELVVRAVLAEGMGFMVWASACPAPLAGPPVCRSGSGRSLAGRRAQAHMNLA